MSRNNSYIFNSEMADAIRLFKRLSVFAIPFIAAAVFIVAVDPFDYLGLTRFIPTDTKYSVARQIDPCFWRLIHFERSPTENILLGDSRMESINTQEVERASGEPFTNLAYGGGTLAESIDSFWIAAKRVKLKRVYMGVALTSYNDYEISNRVQFYSSVRENPSLYFINRGVWEASYYVLYSSLSGKEVKLGIPPMNKDEFWQEELGTLQKYYDKYAEPIKYRKELQSVSDYCRANGIELNFIIFPMHTDAQRQIVSSNMSAYAAAMRRDLSQFGNLFDLEVDNQINRNKDNFNDPIHTSHEIQAFIIDEVWRAGDGE